MCEVIDHVGIRVNDLPASRRMYEAALAELGFVVLSECEFEGDAYVLFGRGDSDDFCLHSVGTKPGRDRVTTGAHIAFCARDDDSVMRWHDAAVRHGGTDIGAPGVRPEYRGTRFSIYEALSLATRALVVIWARPTNWQYTAETLIALAYERLKTRWGE